MVPATDKHYTAAIIERRDFSEDLWLIRVDPGGPFQFKAGQYATLGVDHGDQRIERAYSIVSSPYAKTGKASCSVLAGRRAPCSRRFTSYPGKRQQPSRVA
jgi:ferredoxin-NADP reductase